MHSDFQLLPHPKCVSSLSFGSTISSFISLSTHYPHSPYRFSILPYHFSGSEGIIYRSCRYHSFGISERRSENNRKINR
jgi:hypothetical protein